MTAHTDLRPEGHVDAIADVHSWDLPKMEHLKLREAIGGPETFTYQEATGEPIYLMAGKRAWDRDMNKWASNTAAEAAANNPDLRPWIVWMDI